MILGFGGLLPANKLSCKELPFKVNARVKLKTTNAVTAKITVISLSWIFFRSFFILVLVLGIIFEFLFIISLF